MCDHLFGIKCVGYQNWSLVSFKSLSNTKDCMLVAPGHRLFYSCSIPAVLFPIYYFIDVKDKYFIPTFVLLLIILMIASFLWKNEG